MTQNREIEETVARAAAIVAFYDKGGGQWEDRRIMASELRAVVRGIESLDQNPKTLGPRFFRALRAELVARYGDGVAGRLVEIARDGV